MHILEQIQPKTGQKNQKKKHVKLIQSVEEREAMEELEVKTPGEE